MTNDYDCSILGQHLEFPPDKEEILVTGTGEGASVGGDGDGGEPLRPLGSPMERRQYSSVYTTSSGSDSLNSRHHSYETLNMSDILTSVPHRPAPKPPGISTISPQAPPLVCSKIEMFSIKESISFSLKAL